VCTGSDTQEDGACAHGLAATGKDQITVIIRITFTFPTVKARKEGCSWNPVPYSVAVISDTL